MAKRAYLMKRAVLGTVIALISLAMSVLLFYFIIDDTLLRLVSGINLVVYIMFRVLLALGFFIAFWKTATRTTPRILLYIFGASYTIILYAVVLFKSIGIRGVNLNPFSIMAELTVQPSHIIANFLLFIPVGVGLKYAFRSINNIKIIYISIITTIAIEVAQYIFFLGVSDIIDVMMNGAGISLGVFGYSIVLRILKIHSTKSVHLPNEASL